MGDLQQVLPAEARIDSHVAALRAIPCEERAWAAMQPPLHAQANALDAQFHANLVYSGTVP